MATASNQNPKDPRFRLFRGFMWGLYIVVVAVVSLFLIGNTVKSVWRMSPSIPPVPDQIISVRECVEQADGLWQELEQERGRLATQSPVRDADQRWIAYRMGWVNRFRVLEARCGISGRSREELKALFQTLDGVQDLYMTHAVQYAGEVGPKVDQLKAQLAEARKSAAFGRLP